MGRIILHQARFQGDGVPARAAIWRGGVRIAVWTYQQNSGQISRNGSVIGTGYSGFEQGKNNPALENKPDIGPIPRGKYTIGAPEDIQGGPHGPYVLPLTPDPANQMFGRFGFLIHDDSISHPGMASEGCIILAYAIRERIAGSGDDQLEVI